MDVTDIGVMETLQSLRDEIADLRDQVQWLQITMQRVLDRLPDDEPDEGVAVRA